MNQRKNEEKGYVKSPLAVVKKCNSLSFAFNVNKNDAYRQIEKKPMQCHRV